MTRTVADLQAFTFLRGAPPPNSAAELLGGQGCHRDWDRHPIPVTRGRRLLLHFLRFVNRKFLDLTAATGVQGVQSQSIILSVILSPSFSPVCARAFKAVWLERSEGELARPKKKKGRKMSFSLIMETLISEFKHHCVSGSNQYSAPEDQPFGMSHCNTNSGSSLPEMRKVHSLVCCSLFSQCAI